MHRADPQASRPSHSSHYRRDHRVPAPGRGESAILQPLEGPGPQDLTPRRTRVTIREIPRPVPRRWPIRWIDVITLLLMAAAVAALLVR